MDERWTKRDLHCAMRHVRDVNHSIRKMEDIEGFEKKINVGISCDGLGVETVCFQCYDDSYLSLYPNAG